jgi:hypothetical protein
MGTCTSNWAGRFDVWLAQRGPGQPWLWEVTDQKLDDEAIADGQARTGEKALAAARRAADRHLLAGAGLRDTR